VRVAWKHLPLNIHKDAPLAHAASEAAREQGRFWEYHDKLFANSRKLKPDNLRKYAQELGLDMPRFEKDLVDLEVTKEVRQDSKEAASLGVTGTPGFFINGRFLAGAKPFDAFAELIDAELKRLNLPVPTKAE